MFALESKTIDLELVVPWSIVKILVMSKINILTLIILIFLITGCSSVENNSFGEEREKKITELKEDCSFATVDYDRTGQPLYICYKEGSSIKRSRDKADSDIDSDTDTKTVDTPETPTIE